MIGRIPFRREYAESYSRGDILARTYPELQKHLLGIYASLYRLIRSALPPVPEPDSFAASDRALPFSEKDFSNSYKEIGIISGKGGTGKTTVAASLAFLASNKVMADNDVDAADLHLLLDPCPVEAHKFIGGKKYRIDPDKCTACGLCAEECHFEAISPDSSLKDTHRAAYRIDPFACEGCGFCMHICPEKAVSAYNNIMGNWYVSRMPLGPLVHARLGIGEENSGKLVTQVRKRAAEPAAGFNLDTIQSDGPPGTGCPVIASIVVINKAELNPAQARKIEELAGTAGAPVIGKIPFEQTVEHALRRGKTIVEYDKGPAAEAIRTLWDALKREIEPPHLQGVRDRV